MRTELQAGEQVIYTARKHWMVFFWPGLIAGIFLWRAIPMLASGLMESLGFGDGTVPGLSLNIYVWLAVVPSVMVVWRALERKTNLWIVTNQRYIDESGVLSDDSKECSLDRVQNISVRQAPLGRIMDYGSVVVQTAAEQGATRSKHVAEPKMLRKALLQQQKSFKGGE